MKIKTSDGSFVTISDDELVKLGVLRHEIGPAIRELIALGFLAKEGVGFRLSDDWRKITSLAEAKEIAKRARRATT